MSKLSTIGALALAAIAAPLAAATHNVAAGEGAQERLQEALILARAASSSPTASASMSRA
jgi:hypothetical protein